MLNKLESQKGVTFYLDSHDICKDIDIDDDVTSLRFVSSGYNRYCNASYSLKKSISSFQILLNWSLTNMWPVLKSVI